MLDKLKFLVVDDHPYVREIVQTMLAAVGARQLAFAGSGTRALEIVKDWSPDIVILDMMLPGMGGVEVTKQIRRATGGVNPYLPIIMLTSRTEARYVIEARDAGVTEFVSKPISAANLMRRIESVVMTPRSFVAADQYVGPDRRRRERDDYKGPRRRKTEATPPA